jgi:hypothetical protein
MGRDDEDGCWKNDWTSGNCALLLPYINSNALRRTNANLLLSNSDTLDQAGGVPVQFTITREQIVEAIGQPPGICRVDLSFVMEMVDFRLLWTRKSKVTATPPEWISDECRNEEMFSTLFRPSIPSRFGLVHADCWVVDSFCSKEGFWRFSRFDPE